MTSLKEKATKGMLWSAVEKFSVQGSQFGIGIILARLLMPEDFGLIGMLSIFIALSQTLIDSGMGSGLIQKKNCNELDFSTVFIFNLGVSVIIYALLFFCAPLIAEFYEKSQLVNLTRVLSLNIIINSLTVVQRARLIKDLNFKTIAKVNVVSVIASGSVAVYFAYIGYGVWALVIQQLIRAIVSVAMFSIISKWVPAFFFGRESFKQLFGFGSKLMLAGLYAISLQEIYNILIGKFYAASHLGFYYNSKRFADISAGTVTSIMQTVTYPILASLQDEKEKLISVYRRIIGMTAFLIVPTMTLLSLLSDPFIRLLLTDKWAPAIILLQWMCFARIITPISVINMNILNAVGRSDLFLKVDLSKLPLIILALVITIPIGVEAVVIGHVITSSISFFINAYMPGKLFGYGPIDQLRDMLPIFAATALMATTVFILISLTHYLLLKLMIGVVAGIGSYILASYLLKVTELNEFKAQINRLIANL